MRTLYDILDVPRGASEETIKVAFHRAAKAYHPDLNAGDLAGEKKLREVLAAYHVLKCSEQRAAYDRQLRSRRRVLATRFASVASIGLASGSVVALAVYLSVALTHKHGAPSAAMSFAVQWQQIGASGDPKATWAFAASNEEWRQANFAPSRLMDMIAITDDVSLLKTLRLVASNAIAERAYERLVELGVLPTNEKEDSKETQTVALAVPSQPAARPPDQATSQSGAMQKLPAPIRRGINRPLLDRKETLDRKRAPMPVSVQYLPRQHAENESLRSVMFGVGF